MTLLELRDNVARALFLEQEATVPDYIWNDVTTAINSGLQLMFSSPLDYFRKEEIDVIFGVGESEKNLYSEAEVQEVIGPCWIPAEDSRELHQITDQSEFNQFFQRFYGKNETAAIADGAPEALIYLVRTRRSRSEDSGKDASACFLAIKPTPTAAITVRLLVAKSAPVFSKSTIKNLTGTEVTPVPADKVETILLPLCRMYAMRSHFFFEKDKSPLFEQDAARAMQTLQVSDPENGTMSHISEQMKKQSSRTAQ